MVDLIDPDDERRLRISTTEALASSARIWLERGARGASLKLYRAILTQDPDHVESLTQLAEAAAEDAASATTPGGNAAAARVAAVKAQAAKAEAAESAAVRAAAARAAAARAAAARAVASEAEAAEAEAAEAEAANTAADVADAYYRRADSLSALAPEVYRSWFQVLSDVKRMRQAANVARRYRELFGTDVNHRAVAAYWLALCEEYDDATRLVSESLPSTSLPDAPALSDETARFFVRASRLIAGREGPWSRQGSEVHRVVGDFASVGGRRTAFAAAELAMDLERVDDAERYLNRLDAIDRASGRLAIDLIAVHAKILRARIATRSNRHGQAVELFRTLVQIDSPDWEDHRNDWRVGLAGALYSAGHVVEANMISQEVITELEQESGSEQLEWLVRAKLIRVQSEYDSGNFLESWKVVRSVVEQSAAENLSKSLRAELLRLKCRLEPANARAILDDMDGLRTVDRWAGEEGRAVELTRLEALAWLSDHADRSLGFRNLAEVDLGDALAMFKNTGLAYGSVLRHAYVALLAGKDQLAWDLLHDEATNEITADGTTPEDWRALALRARAALGTKHGDDAFDLYRRSVDLCGHNLDLRCGYVQAALLTGRSDLAMREAEALVRFAPNFVPARILFAQCLSEAGRKNRLGSDGKQPPHSAESTPDGVRANPPVQATAEKDANVRGESKTTTGANAPLFLIQAVHEYTRAFDLHDSLVDYLARMGGKPSPAPEPPRHRRGFGRSVSAEKSRVDFSAVGSDQMAQDTQNQAATMGSHAAIRATIVLAGARLPHDKQLRVDGLGLIKRLGQDYPEEAKRLEKMLIFPRYEDRQRWTLKTGLPILAALLLLAAAVLGAIFADAAASVPSEVRVIVLGLIAAAAIWPFVRTINLPGGIGIEKNQAVSSLADDDILVTGLIRTRLEFRDLLHMPTPAPVQSTTDSSAATGALAHARGAADPTGQSQPGFAQATEGQRYVIGRARRAPTDNDVD